MIGKVLNKKDTMFSDERLALVHKHLLKGENIPSHNHKDCDIFFNLIRGKVEVSLDDSEKYVLYDGDVLSFDGKHFISAKASEDSDIYVYLIRKQVIL